MKAWVKPHKVEWISFLSGMPFICVLLNFLLFGTARMDDYRIWLFSFPVIYVQGFISWYGHVAVMHFLRKKFPDIRQTSLRLTLLAVSHILLITLTYLLLFYGY